MPTDYGHFFNWYHRYWHDWPDVVGTVSEVAKAHARYLGYDVYAPGQAAWDCTPPPGDLTVMGPVVRIRLIVFRRSGKHRKPVHEDLYVDVERRAGKFHAKRATIDPE